MRRTTLNSISQVSLSVLVLTVLLLSQISNAQSAPPKAGAKTPLPRKPTAAAEATPAAPQWASVSVIRIKPDMTNEWIELNKNTIIPALKKAGVKERSCFTTAQLASHSSMPLLHRLLPSLMASRHCTRLWRAGLSVLPEKARRMVTSVTPADESRMDLSYVGKMTGPPNLAVVAAITVAPGRTEEFENLLKTVVLPAVKKGEAKGYFVTQTMLGGDISAYTTVTMYDSFADMAKGSPLVKGMGAAGYASFLRKTAGLVVKAERAVYRFNSELSFGGN
jgi:hypothetical protein